MLFLGTYNVKAIAPDGYESDFKSVTVDSNSDVAKRLDIQIDTVIEKNILKHCPPPSGQSLIVHDIGLEPYQGVELESPNFGGQYPNGPYTCVWRFRVLLQKYEILFDIDTSVKNVI